MKLHKTIRSCRSLWITGILLLASSLAHATDYQWTGNGEGTNPRSWHQADNWMPEGVPGPDDSATIGPTYNVDTGDGYSIDPEGATVYKLILTGDARHYPVLTGGGISVAFSSNSGPGIVQCEAGHLSCILSLDASTTTTLTAQQLALDGGIINNAGTVAWAAGVIQGAGDAKINNSGTFTAGPLTSFGYSGGLNTATFNNTGTFLKIGGDTTTLGDFWALNNSGVVNLQSGNLQLQNVSNQNNVLNNGGRFTGPGRTKIITGLEINGTTTIDAGSVVEMATGAALDLTTSGTFTGPGTFEWSGGEIGGHFNTNALNIAAGTNFLISGADLKTMDGGANINNLGSTVWTGTGMVEDTGSVFNNQGTFTAKNDSTFTYNSTGDFVNTGTFIKSNSSGVTTFDHVNLTNSGVVNVQTGTILLGTGEHLLKNGTRFTGAGRTRASGAVNSNDAGVTIQGTVTIGAGSTLELAKKSRLTGPGTFNGPGTLNWSGGAMEGDFKNHAINIAAGTNFLISGPDQKVLETDVVLNNSGVGVWMGTGDIQNSATFNNLGTLVAQSDALLDYNSSGSFFNKGTFTKQGTSGATRIENTFTNTGTVNINSGTVLFDHAQYDPYIQNGSAASTNLNGGNLSAVEASSQGSPIQEIDFNGGKLTGTGTIRGHVVNKGILSVGRQNGTTSTPGILNITGDYTQGSTATLNMDIGGNAAGTQYDQLKITGAAMLAGTLNVNTINHFVPPSQGVFTLLNYHSHTGSFAHVNGLTLAGQGFYRSAYKPTSFTLTFQGLPTITNIAPLTARAGETVTITGTDFLGATAVAFAGRGPAVPAKFTVVSNTMIHATVPTDGVTLGAVTVTTPAGTASSSAAHKSFAPIPVITGFTPTSGPVGTNVRVTGTNLADVIAVVFNGHNYSFSGPIDPTTHLVVVNLTIPAGAATGPIHVLTHAGVIASSTNFTVTPSGHSVASTAKFSTANAQANTATLRLRFLGALDGEVASDPAHYTVQVNGAVVPVESAGYDASTRSVTLALPVGTLHSNDQVTVAWTDLTDATGATLNGSTGVLVAK
ncbi:MAG: IPT/TIG domain-containing protein [Abitibacteriaceae bacterium]|nr:IPT/TIG domain-containing protein [Abditibacteriaceae bacterium]MBV9864786.1 IPT/TIG domain-containing protein [Abditibacteriaceae bacterium]